MHLISYLQPGKIPKYNQQLRMLMKMKNAEGHDWNIHEETRLVKWKNGEEMRLSKA